MTSARSTGDRKAHVVKVFEEKPMHRQRGENEEPFGIAVAVEGDHAVVGAVCDE